MIKSLHILSKDTPFCCDHLELRFPNILIGSYSISFLYLVRDWVMMDWVDSLVWRKQLELFQMDYLLQDLHYYHLVWDWFNQM